MNAALEFHNDSSPLRYATILPNMADDELDPYEYRLLSHYTRWYNNGKPHREGIRDTAEACQMSVGKVRSTRKELARLGYITFEPATEAERRRGIAGTITVVDRWLENMQRFSNREGKSVQNSAHPPVQNSIDKREREKTKEKDLPPDGGSGGQKPEDESPQTTPSEQSLVSEANAPNPPVAAAPLPPTPETAIDVSPYKAMFSAVCLHVFKITFDMQPDADDRSRIGLIASWLSGNLTKEMESRNVKKLSHAAKPEHVKQFTDWLASAHPRIQIRDLEKFNEYWREFGSEIAKKNAAARRAEEERRKKADDLPPPETEAERLARVEEMRRQKEVVRQQSKATEKVRTDNLWTR